MFPHEGDCILWAALQDIWWDHRHCSGQLPGQVCQGDKGEFCMALQGTKLKQTWLSNAPIKATCWNMYTSIVLQELLNIIFNLLLFSCILFLKRDSNILFFSSLRFIVDSDYTLYKLFYHSHESKWFVLRFPMIPALGTTLSRWPRSEYMCFLWNCSRPVDVFICIYLHYWFRVCFVRGTQYVELPYTVKGMDVSFSGILSYIEVRCRAFKWELSSALSCIALGCIALSGRDRVFVIC